jgi:hypothetical protein
MALHYWDKAYLTGDDMVVAAEGKGSICGTGNSRWLDPLSPTGSKNYANRQWAAERVMLCWNACRHLSDEQLKARLAHAKEQAAGVELRRVREWVASLTVTDMNEIVADGGITAGMVVGQEAAEQLRRIDAALAAPASSVPEGMVPYQGGGCPKDFVSGNRVAYRDGDISELVETDGTTWKQTGAPDDIVAYTAASSVPDRAQLVEAAKALLAQFDSYRNSDLNHECAHRFLVRYEMWEALRAALSAASGEGER